MTRKRCVLVIDDSDTARATMVNAIVGMGYRVVELPSAIGATREILRNDACALIVDVSMPALSGDKLVSVLRANARLKGLVIVMVSGNERGELERVGGCIGVDAVLPKGAIQAQLGPLLARLLAQAEADR